MNTQPLFRLITQRPWLIILVSFVILSAFSAGASKLGFRSDYRVFFSEDNPELIAFDRLQNTYSKDDNVLIVLAPATGNVFTATTLQAIRDLTARSWQIPYSARVDSITNYQHTVSEGDDLYVNDLVPDDFVASDQALETVKSIALNEPQLVHRLVAEDGSVAAINVTLYLPGKSETETPEVAAWVREAVKQFSADHPDIKVYMTGVVMLNEAFLEASFKDASSLIPLMFLVIIALLAATLRSFSATVGATLVIIATIATAVGAFGWGGWFFTGTTAGAPTIIVTIAVADSVHILATFLHQLRLGDNRQQAMQTSLRVNFHPILVTSLTTAIGFLSMNTSEVPPFRDLGNLVAMGVTAGWFFSFIMLPALMMVLPVRVSVSSHEHQRRFSWLAEFVIRHRHILFFGIIALSAGSIMFNTKNQINDEFIHNFDQSIEFRAHTDYVEQHLTGMYTIGYSVHSENGITDPVFLQELDRFTGWLRQQPEVIHVDSISDTFKRLNRNMHGDDDATYVLPDNQQLAAQYLLLYEFSLPMGLDLNNQINMDKTATRVTLTLNNISSSATLNLEQRIKDWVTTNTHSFADFYGASPDVMFSHIGYRNVTSMVTGTLIAMGLITLVLAVVLRSLKLGLISLIPNLMPIGIAFGLWGLLDGNVGIAIATSVGMALGIVVDDTVHFISKYLRARREQNLNSEDAVRYAFSTVGPALWITSVVLVCGFLVLTQSSFQLNSTQGAFAAITITVALLIDFLFLPPLLLLTSESKSDAPASR